MAIKEFVSELGIEKEGTFKDNFYSIELKDSDEYAHYYTLFSNSTIVELLDEGIELTEHGNKITYGNDDYEVNLIADFDSNVYNIVIKE